MDHAIFELLIVIIFLLGFTLIPVIIIPEKKWQMFCVSLLISWSGIGWAALVIVAVVKRFKPLQ
jgi:hypothetical protein